MLMVSAFAAGPLPGEPTAGSNGPTLDLRPCSQSPANRWFFVLSMRAVRPSDPSCDPLHVENQKPPRAMQSDMRESFSRIGPNPSLLACDSGSAPRPFLTERTQFPDVTPCDTTNSPIDWQRTGRELGRNRQQRITRRLLGRSLPIRRAGSGVRPLIARCLEVAPATESI